MVTFEQLKQLANLKICNGVVESWGAQKIEENDNVLKIHVDGLLLTGFVTITPGEKKCLNVEFTDENGQTVSTHKTSVDNLPNLIDGHVERAKEWTDDEYRKRFFASAEKRGLRELYDGLEMLRDGTLQQIMIFDQDGTPLTCTKDGDFIIIKNDLTGKIVNRMPINK